MRKTLLLLWMVISLSACVKKSDHRESIASGQKAIELDIIAASNRWKKTRRIEDLQILRAHLQRGVSADQVESLLGEPDGWTQDDGKEFYEYVAKDSKNKKSDTWNAIFEKRRLIEWGNNGD